MEKPKQLDAIWTHHSKSGYETYIKQKGAGETQFNPNQQQYPDLLEDGIKLAHEKATKFFNNLDPKKDKLFFISSNEARAIATADIYRQEAISQGFEIIKPNKTNSILSDENTDGYIRTSRALSLNPKNYVLHSIFVAELPEKVQQIIANNLPEDIKEKWLKARQIINEAPEDLKKKGWGEMFYQYSDQIQEIFPDIKSSKDLEKQFNTIIKLIQWSKNKFDQNGINSNIKVLGFGHDDYMASVLNQHFGEHKTKSCESFSIEVDGNGDFNIKKLDK